jgi:NADPH:quinone reductase-like Zn-dependent oxidoreductase/acyl carrier protein
VALDEHLAAGGHRVHPAILDAALQAVNALGPSAGDEAMIPVAVERMELLADVIVPAWSTARRRDGSGDTGATMVADVELYDERGERCLVVTGLVLRRTTSAALARAVGARAPERQYAVAWRESDVPPSVTEPGEWVLLADGTGVSASLRARLVRAGHRCVELLPGERTERLNESRWTVDPHDAPSLARVLGKLRDRRRLPMRGVVHCWTLDAREGAAGPTAAVAASWETALTVLRALAGDAALPVWLVTRGAHEAIAGEPVSALQAPLWGLGAVASIELPSLRLRCVDLDVGMPAPDAAESLATELARADDESRVALRGDGRRVARLVPAGPAAMASEATTIALRAPGDGTLDGMALVAVPRQPCEAGEVAIAVEAAGLNFRGVLIALGMVEGSVDALGAECVGIVTEVGAGVESPRLGERVMAFAPGALAAHVVVPAELAVPVPASLDVAEAATIPVAYLTALHALREVANVRPGDRVLVHAAAGGVGMAAVRLARVMGAEILATAGTPEKRALLEAQGIAHVLDSRSTSFASELRERTGGRGVDVVVNSLSGEMARASLDALADGGRFVELGKRDLMDPAEVAREHRGIRWAAFDLADIGRARPAAIAALWREVLDLLARGEIAPLPLERFPIARAADAFRYMAQARHVGKIVLEMSGDAVARARSAAPVRADGAYVVTGGLGALGVHVARWLVARGARRVALLGRRDAGAEATRAIESLREVGAEVRAFVADVTDRASLAAALGRVRAELGAVRGVVHAAGLLADAPIERLEWSGCVAAIAPKADGARWLDELTRDDPVELFLLFSSLAATSGWAGQAAYAAGNAYLDALAHERRSRGLPSLSVAWGAWADGGMARGVDASGSYWTERGLRPMATDDALAALEEALASGDAHRVVLEVDWRLFLQRLHPRGAPPFYLELARAAKGPAAVPAGARPAARSILAELAEATPSYRVALVEGHVSRLAAQALGLASGARLDVERPLSELGLDSLMAVELRNALAASLERALPATLLFDHPTVRALTTCLAHELGIDDGAALERGIEKVTMAIVDDALAAVAAMSEDEAEAELLRELEAVERGAIRG